MNSITQTSCFYQTTTLFHVRPLDTWQRLILRCCLEPLTLAEIAAYTGLRLSSVIWLLESLERRGLVTTVSAPDETIWQVSAESAPLPSLSRLAWRRLAARTRRAFEHLFFTRSLDVSDGPMTAWDAMRDGPPVIDVWNLRCMVSRWVWPEEDKAYTIEHAVNWQELEAQAEIAVNAQGGAANISGIYRCPVDLAAQAIFAPHANVL